MPQIIILRPPRTTKSLEIGMAADVTVIDGGTRVEMPNVNQVRIVCAGGQVDIYTDEDVLAKKPE